MIDLKKERIVWRGRPSFFLYLGTYILSVITLICCDRLEDIIVPGDEPVGYLDFLFNYLFVTPLHDWPFHNPRFVGIFLLQCIEIVVMVKLAYRLLQTQFTHYVLTNKRLIIGSFSVTGLTNQEVELYRISDVSFIKPIPGMLWGLSHLDIHSNDSFMPQMLLQGLVGGNHIYKVIRSQAFKNREHTLDGLPPIPVQHGPASAAIQTLVMG
jgi:hypothetical protein